MRLRLNGIARVSKARDSRFKSCQTRQTYYGRVTPILKKEEENVVN